MKNVIKWLIIALLLAAVLIGATLLYNKLSEGYKGNNLASPSSQGEETDDPQNGEEAQEEALAEDFTVLDYEGNEVNLSDYRGKPVVLNFWATWCYYCKEEMPDFNLAAEEYPEVQFMMVNATDGLRETMESAKEYVEQMGFEFDVFFDVYMEATADYSVTAYPTTFFIDADGSVVTYANGMLDYESLIDGIKMITE